MTNYFDILNVSIEAEPEVIKASYRTLAKKYHPDSFKGGKEEAEKKMAQINEAYQVLSDELLRAEYIKKLGVSRASSDNPVNGHREQAPNSESRKNNVTTATREYQEDNNYYNPEMDKYSSILSKLIVMVIIVSIICCIVHFGPSIWNEFFENLTEQIEELKYNFSL